MEKLIQRFPEARILVIGDAILDTYSRGSATRICREAPVPVFDVETEESVCGGAANTAINLASLGASTWFATVTGSDPVADKIISLLQASHVNTHAIVRDGSRSSVAKQRLMAGSSILFRIDDGTTSPLCAETENELMRRISFHWDNVDAIVISDYGYGTLTDRLVQFIRDVMQHLPKPLIVDAKDPSRFACLHPTVVKPNYQEAISLLAVKALAGSERASHMIQHAHELFERSSADHITVTLDKDGVVLLKADGTHHRILCIPFDNRNAIGAGDTFTAAITLALVAGATPEKACEIASQAAAVVVQKEGTSGCTRHELLSRMSALPKFITNTDTLRTLVGKLRLQGKRIVFTNGCFDILHKGHVNFLEAAAKHGDVLLLAINNDASIRRIKGPGRPINSLEDRVTVLSALGAVHYIMSFDEDSPAHLLEVIRPDVFVKGNTYSHAEEIPEAGLAGELGSEVIIIPAGSAHSTTSLINKIKYDTAEN